jgi:hypothetical protein
MRHTQFPRASRFARVHAATKVSAVKSQPNYSCTGRAEARR